MNDIGMVLGPIMTALVQILKALGLPREFSFGTIIVLGIAFAVVLQYNQGAFAMLMQAVQSIAVAVASYESLKNINLVN